MNYYREFKSTPSNRSPYFQYVLSLFNEKPINILELGTSRELTPAWIGDGRSSYHFIEYIDKFGGKLTTVDMESQYIENAKILLKDYPNFDKLNVDFIVDDALKVLDNPKINNEYLNLVYLDVGDDPQLTLDCFEKISINNTVVFVDDFSSKGVLLAQKYPNYCQMAWPQPINHLMALYKKNQIKSWMFVEPIEK